MDEEKKDIYDTSTYTYHLPQELIAQNPLPDRASSRMMVVDRKNSKITHHVFRDFPDLIPGETMLVINNTKVLPVRLVFTRPTGGKSEVLLLRHLEGGQWKAMCRPAARMNNGDVYRCGDCIDIEILSDLGGGFKTVNISTDMPSLEDALLKAGDIPLPPYIRRNARNEEDTRRYQTVFAEIPGSAAAPTAGFHFTDEVMNRLAELGIPVERITLHVGAGTFLPIRSADIREHEMHSEWFSVSAELLEKTGDPQRKVLAVGTTSVRALESAARMRPETDGSVSGETELFIHPGFKFRAVNAMLTNFHLPESTLLMLVCGFAGTELTLRAYEEAVKEKYRFYSYGDCMLIL